VGEARHEKPQDESATGGGQRGDPPGGRGQRRRRVIVHRRAREDAMMAGIEDRPGRPGRVPGTSPIVRQTGICESRVEAQTTRGDESMQTDILSQWRRHAREQGDAIAFIAPHRNWTYADLDTESNRIAQGLLALGIGPGDRVAALTKHTGECLALMTG